MEGTTQQSFCIVKGATVHELCKNSKKKIAEGNCNIYQQNQENFLRLVHFVINLKNMSFVKIVYKYSISYFFSENLNTEKVLCLSISTQKNIEKEIKQFESHLKNTSEIIESRNWQAESNLFKNIQHSWPEYEQKAVQSNGNKITKISKQIGSFVGAISGFVNKPLNNISNKAGMAKESLYQSQVKDQTKNKWQMVKQKAGKLNQSLSEVLKPVNDKAKVMTSSIGHSFNHSQNSIIKAIRDFGLATKNALNDGYSQGMGQKKVETKLEQQSDNYLGKN